MDCYSGKSDRSGVATKLFQLPFARSMQDWWWSSPLKQKGSICDLCGGIKCTLCAGGTGPEQCRCHRSQHFMHDVFKRIFFFFLRVQHWKANTKKTPNSDVLAAMP